MKYLDKIYRLFEIDNITADDAKNLFGPGVDAVPMKITKIQDEKITLEASADDLITLFVRAYHQSRALSSKNENERLQQLLEFDQKEYQKIISELEKILGI